VNPKVFLSISIISFAVGGAFLGFYSLKTETISQFPIFLQYVSNFSWIPGVILLLVGFALLITYCLGVGVQYFLQNCRYYECRKARESDLQKIYDIATELYDWNVSPLEIMKQWHKHNKSIFWVIEKKVFSKNKMIKSFEGYFCVIPIEDTTLDPFLKGEVTGASFETKHITPDRRKFSTVYVGGVAAYSNTAKGHAMLGLKQYINFLFERGVTRILTRPVNSDGLRVAQHHNFVPLGIKPDVGSLYEITKQVH
jgi:hypothetical protein